MYQRVTSALVHCLIEFRAIDWLRTEVVGTCSGTVSRNQLTFNRAMAFFASHIVPASQLILQSHTTLVASHFGSGGKGEFNRA